MTQFDEKLTQIYDESGMKGGVVKGRLARAFLSVLARIALRRGR